MGEYLLGIDIGTSACKIAVFAKDGTVKATGTGDYQVYYPHPGWAEQNPEEWWEDVDEGEQLVLIRDYNNKHDFNAVAIAFAGDYEGDPENFDFEYIIGYVPQSDNELIAQLMDQGLHNTFIAELTTKKMNGTMKERLRMTIYVQSDEEQEDMEALSCNTFAVKVNIDDFKGSSNELENLGSEEFQWGGITI